MCERECGGGREAGRQGGREAGGVDRDMCVERGGMTVERSENLPSITGIGLTSHVKEERRAEG